MSVEAPRVGELTQVRAELSKRESKRKENLMVGEYSGMFLAGGIGLNLISMFLAAFETAEVHLRQLATASGNLAIEVTRGDLGPAEVAIVLGLFATTAGLAIQRSKFRHSAEGLRGDIEEIIGPLNATAHDGQGSRVLGVDNLKL